MSKEAAKEVVTGTVATGGALLSAGVSTGLIGGAASGTAGALTGSLAGALSAAGVSAAVPIAGWIVAGGITLFVGIQQLVSGLKNAKVRREEAVARAKELGLPDPETVPSFVVGALSWDAQKRNKELGKLVTKLPTYAKRKSKKKFDQTVAKVKILAALNLLDRQQASLNLPPSPPPQQVALITGVKPKQDIGGSDWLLPTVAGVAGVSAVLILGYAVIGGRS
jgi:hypothetical protein